MPLATKCRLAVICRYVKPYGPQHANHLEHALGSGEDPLAAKDKKETVERITPALGVAWGLGFPDGEAAMTERPFTMILAAA